MIEKCMTEGGPDPNKECVFPFRFLHQRLTVFYNYSKCPLDHVGKLWCPTKLDPEGMFSANFPDNRDQINKNWGYCSQITEKSDCKITANDLPAGDEQSFRHYDV